MCDPLPFSVCEAGATVLILAALLLLARALWQTAHGSPGSLGTWALHLAVVVLWGYAAVCGLWGTQYYAASFAQQAGMAASPVTAAQLEAVTRYFGQQVAACAGTVPRDGEGRFAVARSAILEDTEGLYDGLTGDWPLSGGAGPEAQARLLFPADERLGLHRVSVPPYRGEHPPTWTARRCSCR